MRVLWLCNIMLPIIAKDLNKEVTSYGGWLTGLSSDLLQVHGVELAIAFPITFQKKLLMGETDGLQYYGFPIQKRNEMQKYSTEIESFLESIVKDFDPDVIHIFGTEYPYCLAMVNISEKLGFLDHTVISIQGLVSVCARHYYEGLPLNIINSWTLRDILRHDNIRNQKHKFEEKGKYEIQAIKKTKHVIGRTDWDYACTKKLNPDVKYHFCNETLREAFYHNDWNLDQCEKHSIFISQCNYPVKGFHFMLEAMVDITAEFPDAHIYTTGKDLSHPNIKARIKRTSYSKYLIKLIAQYNLQDKITFMGILDEEQMCARFLKSHVFVSCSTIENSPNSVGEAMILGVPTVSSDVGGVKNMMKHGVEGFIYQSTAPYMLAHYIIEIFKNNELALQFSKNAKVHANETYNRKKNLETILNIYSEIVSTNKDQK